MCNEFSFTQTLGHLIATFAQLQLPIHWAGGAPNLEPRESIRPTDPAAILVSSPTGAELLQRQWGFPRERGGPVINFRSEGRQFGGGRCLIPADAFYEFTGAKAPKSKWRFSVAEGGFFCIAGLVRDDRFTMLTTAPGPDIAPYHDRQVVLLPKSQWGAWLNPAAAPANLGPPPAGTLAVEQIR